MLEKMAIGVLLCIVAIQFILIKVLMRRACEAEKHARSWKAACEEQMLKSGDWQR